MKGWDGRFLGAQHNSSSKEKSSRKRPCGPARSITSVAPWQGMGGWLRRLPAPYPHVGRLPPLVFLWHLHLKRHQALEAAQRVPMLETGSLNVTPLHGSS